MMLNPEYYFLSLSLSWHMMMVDENWIRKIAAFGHEKFPANEIKFFDSLKLWRGFFPGSVIIFMDGKRY